MDLPHREGWTIGTRLMKRLRRAEGLLVVLDDFTRECPAIEVGRSCRGEDVVAVLDELTAIRGAPGHLRSDNGPEFICGEAMVRTERHGHAVHRPRRPMAGRDRGELQRTAEGRAAVVGTLRDAGGDAVLGGPPASSLQPSTASAGAGEADAGGLRGGVPGAASVQARCARLRCGVAGHAGGWCHEHTLTRGGPMRATPSKRLHELTAAPDHWGPLPTTNRPVADLAARSPQAAQLAPVSPLVRSSPRLTTRLGQSG